MARRSSHSSSASPREADAPRVSVVLPAFQAEATVEAAVRSILEQTLRDLEVVVVDDASTDGTADVVSAIDDPRLRLLRNERNRGIAETMNRAIAESRGAYVARMDADDVALPRRLERTAAVLDARPEVGIVGGRARKTRPDRRRTRLMAPVLPDACVRARCVLEHGFHNPTTIMRRSALDRLDHWCDPELDYVGDQDLWLRLALVAETSVVPDVVLVYRGRSREGRRELGERIRDEERRCVRKRVDAFLGAPSPDLHRAAEALATPHVPSSRDVPVPELLALGERLVERSVEIDFAPAPAMASSIANLLFMRYKQAREPAAFRASRDLRRRYRVPLAHLPRASRRRWWAARIRHG